MIRLNRDTVETNTVATNTNTSTGAPLNVTAPDSDNERTLKALSICKMIQQKTMQLPVMSPTIQPV